MSSSERSAITGPIPLSSMICRMTAANDGAACPDPWPSSPSFTASAHRYKGRMLGITFSGFGVSVAWRIIWLMMFVSGKGGWPARVWYSTQPRL